MATNLPTLKVPKMKIPKIPGLGKPKVDESVRLSVPDYILGLDMSLEHTGYCLTQTCEGGRTIHGVFEPNPNKSKKVIQILGMKRLNWLRAQVIHLAKTGYTLEMCQPLNAERIKCLVLIEGYAFGAKGSAGISLGELGGVIRIAMFDNAVPYIEIPPTQLKKFITGKGGAVKDIVLKEVFKRYGFDTDDNNVADAYSLMQLGRAITNTQEGALLAHQKEVVTDVVRTYFRDNPLPATPVAA
jgi:Holliday junction resolvasome RuvABC endonuclease subunit